MNELWLPVVGYEGFYEVSNQGRVRSVDRVVPHSNGPRLVKGRILKQIPNSRGYFRVCCYREGKSRALRVHRLVCVAFCGPSPSAEHVVDHIDENKQNNRATNLRWLTVEENVSRSNSGTGNAGCRLTEQDVRFIRSDSRSAEALGKVMGVSRRHIDRIRAREKWAHVA